MNRNIWKDGIWGVIVGDALGEPVQFMTRTEIAIKGPVQGMESGRLFSSIPAGTWTDDSSLTLALLDSIRTKKSIDLCDIMERFCRWFNDGEYTPFGEAFDIGGATERAICRYMKNPDPYSCGGTSGRDNGNGSLMRIMPACLFAYEQQIAGASDEEALKIIHEVGGLTHNHMRAKIACGIYYFCVRSILNNEGPLIDLLQKGMSEGFEYYRGSVLNLTQLAFYHRLSDLYSFANTAEDGIKSTGYVVDAFEAAIWALITTESFSECELKAVNLAGDSDTVAAIAGGLAGLYYGYESISQEWLDAIQRKEYIRGIIDGAGYES